MANLLITWFCSCRFFSIYKELGSVDKWWNLFLEPVTAVRLNFTNSSSPSSPLATRCKGWQGWPESWLICELWADSYLAYFVWNFCFYDVIVLIDRSTKTNSMILLLFSIATFIWFESLNCFLILFICSIVAYI